MWSTRVFGYVSNAEYVFTDSYHGMLFSILFKRQFWSIAREYGEYDQSSRQLSVLKMLGLTNRYCVANSNISEEVIDYEILQIKLESEKSKFISFFKKSLES